MKANDNDLLFEELCSDFERRLSKLTEPTVYGEGYVQHHYPGLFERVLNDAKTWITDWYHQYETDPDEEKITRDIMIQSIAALTGEVMYNAEVNGMFDRYLFLSQVFRHIGVMQYKAGWKKDGRETLLSAHYYLGNWKGAMAYEEWQLYGDNSQAVIEDKTRRGGEARARKFDWVKSEVIRLLGSGAVAGEWKSKDAAIRSISGELKAFISREDKKIRQENENIPRGKQERQPVGLIFNNLHRTIADWSRNDERVKTAFSRAVIRGKKK